MARTKVVSMRNVNAINFTGMTQLIITLKNLRMVLVTDVVLGVVKLLIVKKVLIGMAILYPIPTAYEVCKS